MVVVGLKARGVGFTIGFGDVGLYASGDFAPINQVVKKIFIVTTWKRELMVTGLHCARPTGDR